MAAIVNYGPLIDLSYASSYTDGGYVQLLVFVHRSSPIQYKILKKSGGREVIRTDVQVGDDTRLYFPLSIWHKHIVSLIVPGAVVLLQNVKIMRFGGLEAKTLHCSSILCLVQPYESLISKDVADLVGQCQVSILAKNKLHKVIKWLQKSVNVHGTDELNHFQSKRLKTNWKVHKQPKFHDCFSLKELCLLFDSCEASFYASIGEIFLPITCRNLYESEPETMFISRRLGMLEDNNLIEDLVVIGCQLCGTPLNQDHGSALTEPTQFYCQKSSNHLHVVHHIYRPFMLYVWDDSRCISLLVTNEAAELLFGNIGAEKVYSSYQRQKQQKTVDAKQNLYMIWLILLKTLLQKEKNSLLKFKVSINATRDWDSGKFEMVFVSLPTSN